MENELSVQIFYSGEDLGTTLNTRQQSGSLCVSYSFFSYAWTMLYDYSLALSAFRYATVLRLYEKGIQLQMTTSTSVSYGNLFSILHFGSFRMPLAFFVCRRLASHL
jgi:hypothetical protein